jgi:hypothetical protein
MNMINTYGRIKSQSSQNSASLHDAEKKIPTKKNHANLFSSSHTQMCRMEILLGCMLVLLTLPAVPGTLLKTQYLLELLCPKQN